MLRVQPTGMKVIILMLPERTAALPVENQETLTAVSSLESISKLVTVGVPLGITFAIISF